MMHRYTVRQQYALGFAGSYHELLEQEEGSVVPHVLARCSSSADAHFLAALLGRTTETDRCHALREAICNMQRAS